MTFGLVPNNDESSAVDAGNGVSIYVAAASSELERAKAIMKRLRDAGFTVTSTWVETITNVGDANPMHASQEDRAKWSMDDLNQVMDAQVLWLLIPPRGVSTDGANVELGFALAMQAMAQQARESGIPAPDRFVVSSGTERSIFTALTNHYSTDDEAFAAVLEGAAKT